uniref:Transposase n=1 Tax=Schistosoma curassoni TaxID=6186 RepID=A0A183KST7_9TREM
MYSRRLSAEEPQTRTKYLSVADIRLQCELSSDTSFRLY